MKKSTAYGITAMAMLFALAMVLSFLENTLPPLPGMPPGFKLGLSNIAVMYALFFMGGKKACVLAVLKSFFVVLMRGFVAGALSLCGGLLSVIFMYGLSRILKDKISYLMLSIGGAIVHNLGQLIAITVIMTSTYALYYTPVLIIAGVIMGTLTGTLLKAVMPALSRLNMVNKK